jgi:hypothetical protein
LRKIGVAFVLLVLAGAGCLGSGHDRQASALGADRERIEALISADPGQLDRVLHDSLTYTHSNGRTDSKVSLVESLESGGVEYRSIEPRRRSVRVHGDTAVVTAAVRMQVAAGDRELDLTSVYTAVYWWQDGRWQLAAYQSNPAEP